MANPIPTPPSLSTVNLRVHTRRHPPMATSTGPLPPPSLSAAMTLRVIRSNLTQLMFLSFLYLITTVLSIIAMSNPTGILFGDQEPGFRNSSVLFYLCGFPLYSLGLWAVTRSFLRGPSARPFSETINLVGLSYFELLLATFYVIVILEIVFGFVQLVQTVFMFVTGVSQEVDRWEFLMSLSFLIRMVCWVLKAHELMVELTAALRWSVVLMRGSKALALTMLLVSASVTVVLGRFSTWVLGLSGDEGWRIDWIVTVEFVVRILAASVMFMLVLLLNAVGNALLCGRISSRDVSE